MKEVKNLDGKKVCELSDDECTAAIKMKGCMTYLKSETPIYVEEEKLY